MDRLKAMQTFVQIAEQGSLTRAAAAMGLSLPVVVRSLAALESHLGVRLFQRTTRRIALTDEGRTYLDRTREVLAAADAADRAVSTDASALTGALTLTAPVMFGQMYVAPALVRFMQQHPQLQCRLLLQDRVLDLLEEGIDVGVRISPLGDSTLIAHTLGHIHRVTVASPALVAERGLPTHPSDLLDAPVVHVRLDAPSVWRYQPAPQRQPGARRARALQVRVRPRLAFNHIQPALQACVAGIGFGQFLSYQVQPYVDRGELVPVLTEFEPPARPVSVVYPHARGLPARTRLFVDWLRGDLKAASGWQISY